MPLTPTDFIAQAMHDPINAALLRACPASAFARAS
jgi:hypothetical protein